jgi:hypothetical protein
MYTLAAKAMVGTVSLFSSIYHLRASQPSQFPSFTWINKFSNREMVNKNGQKSKQQA